MTRFDRYLLSQLTVYFGFFALVMVTVYWVNRAIGLFDRLIADGQSALVFLEFTALTLPNVIRIVLPVAGFAAAVYVTNRLRSDSEMVVASAAGLSPWRVARGYVAFGLMLAVLIAALVHWLTPLSRDRLAVRSAEVSQDSTARLLKEATFVHPRPGVTFYVREISSDGGLLDVFLTDQRGGRAIDYVARRAFLTSTDGIPHLVLFDGEAHELVDGRLSVTRFSDLSYDISDLTRDAARGARGPKDLTTAELFEGGLGGPELLELHRRLAQSVLCLATVLVGYAAMTLGAFSRFGAGPQVGIAVAAFIAIKVAEGAALDAMGDDASRFYLHYASPMLGLVLAALMLWHASSFALSRRAA